MPKIFTGPPASSRASRCIALALRHGQLHVAFISATAVYIFRHHDELLQIIERPFGDNALSCVAFDRRSGAIAVSSGLSVKIYNELATYDPLAYNQLSHLDADSAEGLDVKWIYGQETLVQGSNITSLSWGLNRELLVGHDRLSLFQSHKSLPDATGMRCSWSFPLASPVEEARFSPDASFIVSHGPHDRVVKVWRRLSDRVSATGAKTSDFDFIYLPHDRAVLDVKWRQPFYEDLVVDNIVYTSSLDGHFRAWASDIPHDSHLLTMHERIPLVSSGPIRKLPVVLDDDVFSWALAKAVKRDGSSQEYAKVRSMLQSVSRGQPEIVLLWDEQKTMSAYALDNLGNRNAKPSTQKMFFQSNECHLFSKIEGGEILWITADVCRHGDNDLLFFVGSDCGISTLETTIFDLFSDDKHAREVKYTTQFFGHSQVIEKLASSSDGLISTDERGGTEYWTVNDGKLQNILDKQQRNSTTPVTNGTTVSGILSSLTTTICCQAGSYTALVQKSDTSWVQIWNTDDITSFSGSPEATFRADSMINGICWNLADRERPLLAVSSDKCIQVLAARVLKSEECSAWSVQWSFSLTSLTTSKLRSILFLEDQLLCAAAGPNIYTFSPSEWHPQSIDDRESALSVPIYSPSSLELLLLFNKLSSARFVLMTLYQQLISSSEKVDLLDDLGLSLDEIFDKNSTTTEATINGNNKYNSLFGEASEANSTQNDNTFSEASADSLISLLREMDISQLNTDEKEHIGVIAKALVSVRSEEASLDEMGLRFYLSYTIMQGRNAICSTTTPFVLSDLDIMWAYKSEKQDILLSLVLSSVKSLTWESAKAAKIFYWLRERAAILSTAEVIAKAEFLKGEDRDPVSASLWYHALRKKNVLLSLWRTCGSHAEHNLTTKILANNFQETKWRTAANKNAFALIGRRRFAYAAAWFLLAGSLKDAVSVCTRNLDDVDLALAIARIYSCSSASSIDSEVAPSDPALRSLVGTDIRQLAESRRSKALVLWTHEFLGDGGGEVLMRPAVISDAVMYAQASRDSPGLFLLLPSFFPSLSLNHHHHQRQEHEDSERAERTRPAGFLEYARYLVRLRGLSRFADRLLVLPDAMPSTTTTTTINNEGGADAFLRGRAKVHRSAAPTAVFQEPTMDSFAAFDF